MCFQIDHATNEPCGVWWEIWDDDVAGGYLEPISMVALIGTMEMLSKSPLMTWWEHWDRLAERVSPNSWWEVIEVDDESYEKELLYDLPSCHPRAVERGDVS